MRDQDPLTKVIERELSVGEGMTVWDIGAGGGYWTRRMAEKTGPRGKVVATDINLACVRYIEDHSGEWGPDNVSALHVQANMPTGEPSPVDRLMLALGGKGTSIIASADRILLSNSIEFRQSAADVAAEQVRIDTEAVVPLLYLGLKPGGRLVYLRDFDTPDCLRANQVIDLFESAGFMLVDEADPKALQHPNQQQEGQETRCRVFAVFTKRTTAKTNQRQPCPGPIARLLEGVWTSV